jgi:hypothetical protein
MVLPPPGRDRSAETTEQQETDRLRESSSTIPFEREATSIPVTGDAIIPGPVMLIGSYRSFPCVAPN